MANKIIIKNGAGAPPADALSVAELGFDTANKKVYIGHADGPVEIGTPDLTVDLSGSANGTANTVNADTLGGQLSTYYAKATKLTPYNLLNNSDFRNPVNQRGQTSYKGAVYGIDRWVFNRPSYMLTVEDGHIRISDNPDSTNTQVGMLQQFIPITPDIAGKTVTLVARVKGVDVRLNINDKATSSYTKSEEYDTVAVKGTVPTDEETFFVALQFRNAANAICEWIALYEGEYTAETLPEYQPKGYGAELAECQRYYENSWYPLTKNERSENFAFCYSNLNADGIAFYKQTKRIVPTVTFYPAGTNASWQIYNDGTYKEVGNPESLPRDGIHALIYRITKASNDNTTWASGKAIQAHGHWEASADL